MIDLTPLFRIYARRRRQAVSRENAVAVQNAQLMALIGRAKDTRFGRDHDFAKLRSIGDFQRAVPLRRYENFWTDYWKEPFPVLDNVSWPGRIPFFAASSGTTSGTSKYIPVTAGMNRANARAALDLLVHHLHHRPKSRVLGGKSFMLGGSTALVERAPGIASGDLSGIAMKERPRWLRPFTFPPAEIGRETDFEKKVEKIVELAPRSDIRVVAGTPSWLLLLFDRQMRRAGAHSLRALYPKLELVVHGGVNFKPYRARFESLLDGAAELREAYAASEGFIALQDETPETGLRLIADNGLFFEFVPVEELGRDAPTRHTVADAEPGVNYALVLTSCAGLFAYVIGDTVRFVSRDPPRILVTGRTSYSMSAFGEHLIGEEIENAVVAAADSIGETVSDFSMGALFPAAAGEAGGHLYVVEFAGGLRADALARFSAALDQDLKARNDDYRSHRGDSSVKPPEILAVPPGTFAGWMKARGRMGGQNKVPRVINDTELFRNLLSNVRDAMRGNSSP
jgi:hypothetical protein